MAKRISYAVTVRGDVPANLAQRIQDAHAAAIRAEKGPVPDKRETLSDVAHGDVDLVVSS